MLVVPIYKDDREIPGGYVDRGETPRQGVIREVREELGISPPIGRLLVADWAPDDTDGDKILFVFDGGTLSARNLADIRLPPDEIAAYEFREVADLHLLTADRLVRRVTHACAARADGSTRYLEHGADRFAD